MTRHFILAAILVGSGACYNQHVNGTALRPDQVCTRNWTAVVNNTTTRVYDLYIGSRFVGSADARSTSRTIIDPAFGLVTPTLREAAVTRNQKGPRLRREALVMVCE